MKDYKKSLGNILKNKYFLYFVFIIAFFNILGYIGTNNYKALICFILVGFITTRFNKNMAVVLLSAILITAILLPLFHLSSAKEGMKNATSTSTSSSSKKTNPTKKPTKKEGYGNNIAEGVNIETAHGNNFEEQETKVKNTESLDTLNKGLKGNGKKTSNHIDLAATLEESYDNLNSMLGTEGITNLTNDTKQLMAQQEKLYKNMEAMTPLVNSAKKMLESFDMSKFNDMLGSVSSLGLGTKM